jgi:hypothetical protein
MSFDVEEFDMPLEYNQSLSIYEQMETGFKGLQATMSVINGNDAPCTFFTTANFANWFADSIKQMSRSRSVAKQARIGKHNRSAGIWVKNATNDEGAYAGCYSGWL